MKRLVVSAILLLACVPGVRAHREGPRTRPAARRPRIVFSSNRSGPWRIWIVNPDGSGMKQLTRAKDDEHDVDPVLGPEVPARPAGGGTILFTSTRGPKTGVWRMALAGKPQDRICDGDQAEWAPDGKRIVFRKAGRIVVRDLARRTEKAVSPKAWTRCSAPAWSPDGETLAFARLVKGRNALYLIPAAGGRPTKLYDKEGACEPHFSPDGRRIVYETETHICTINVDGTKNRLVTYYGGVQRYGRFSPDGKSIVFCQGPSPRGPWELYVVPAAGGTPRRLTRGASDMYPHWR